MAARHIAQPEPGMLLLNILLVIWSLAWVGLALWKSAEYKQKYWFIIFLITHYSTIGVLPIIYLFFFAKHKMKFKDFKHLVFWKSFKEK